MEISETNHDDLLCIADYSTFDKRNVMILYCEIQHTECGPLKKSRLVCTLSLKNATSTTFMPWFTYILKCIIFEIPNAKLRCGHA